MGGRHLHSASTLSHALTGLLFFSCLFARRFCRPPHDLFTSFTPTLTYAFIIPLIPSPSNFFTSSSIFRSISLSFTHTHTHSHSFAKQRTSRPIHSFAKIFAIETYNPNSEMGDHVKDSRHHRRRYLGVYEGLAPTHGNPESNCFNAEIGKCATARRNCQVCVDVIDCFAI